MMGGRLVFLLGLGWLLCASVQATPEPWVLVDTKSRTLKVIQGDKPLETFKGIAFGRNGAGIKLKRGDKKTPVGIFRVGWISVKSRYRFFIGLDYPNLDYAKQAYEEKRIDMIDFLFIRHALMHGLTPPQNTPLGGFIGIHGIGNGDPWIHANFDWTDGCVALNNDQIQRLAPWVQVGTRVEIR